MCSTHDVGHPDRLPMSTVVVTQALESRQLVKMLASRNSAGSASEYGVYTTTA
jgi:hypothetical protein